MNAFAADMKAVARSLAQLQASAVERARAIEAQHAANEESFQLTYKAHEAAAAFAQRNYEIAEGGLRR